jgi:hypothetical protein
MTDEEIKAFIRLEVRKALAEISQEGMTPEQQAETRKKFPYLFNPLSETKHNAHKSLPDGAREW